VKMHIFCFVLRSFLFFNYLYMRVPTPRRFRKVNRHSLRITYEQKRCTLRFGTHGLQATENGFVTARQLEAVRRTLTRRLSRKRKIWLRATPDYPRTAKPKEVRMGRGKGNVSEWVCVVKRGRILLEAGAAPTDYPRLREALLIAQRKLPVFVQLITRNILTCQLRSALSVFALAFP